MHYTLVHMDSDILRYCEPSEHIHTHTHVHTIAVLMLGPLSSLMLPHLVPVPSSLQFPYCFGLLVCGTSFWQSPCLLHWARTLSMRFSW